MNVTFIAGQRWISDTESDLGLGTVLDTAHRRVTLAFPATAETRIYATDSAPLTRVTFQPGDTVSSHEGWQLRIEEVTDEAGLLTYIGTRTDTEAPAVLNEAGLDNFLRFKTPRDRLFAGLLDGKRWFRLRASVFEHRHTLTQSPVRGLMGARVAVLPHQMYIALEALQRQHPRLLLADEVGLGKTIEAGLIMHAALRRNRIRRVLILVPDALLHQWLVEMLRRFNLHFSIMDKERYTELQPSAPESNPFLSEQRVLCPLSTLLDDESIANDAASAGWDMLIVDEAHHLEWTPEAASPAYCLTETLAARTPSVLLLTATPEQLGQAGHFARLRLLDPERFGSLEQYQREEAEFTKLGSIADQLLQAEPLDNGTIRQLEALFGEPFSDTERSILTSQATLAMSDLGPQLVERLIDRHGTGRLMFRNTRQAISGFPGRRLYPYSLHDDAQETLIAWLSDFLSDHYPRKILLICSRMQTVKNLAEALRIAGINTAQFHEAMSIVERDRAAAWFADPEENCRLLLCSEIGSEGRNFQFLHDVILLELPDNPDLLEQRIGRLDRIGQTETINIHVPVSDGSRDALLRLWYHEGLNAFERICPSGSAVRAQVEPALQHAITQAETTTEPVETHSLLEATRTHRETLDQQMEQGRDRLLELHSNRPERIEEHLDALSRSDRSFDLQDFMAAVFDRFGVDITEQSKYWIIHPSDHMQVEHFPHLPADGLSLTFDRDTALVREDLTYLSWDHPMVQAAMDLILDEGFGQADCQVVACEHLPKTLTWVEASYVLQCPAEPDLAIEQYLPAQLQSFAIGIDGKDYTPILQQLSLDGFIQRYSRNKLRKVVAAHRQTIESMIEQTTHLAEACLPDLLSQATEAIASEHEQERSRLVELARVNPSVRQSEIDSLDALRDRRLAALDAAHAHPVSLRVMFNS